MMTVRPGWLLFAMLFAMLLAPQLAQAAESPSSQSSQTEAGFSHYALTNGYANWDSAYIDGAHSFGARQSLYGEFQEARRFNLIDREVSGGYYYPLSARWTALVEASTSPEHNFLAKHSAFGQLQVSFEDGWDIQGGLRHSQYTPASADMMVLTAERYWGNFRAALTQYEAQLQGSGTAPSHSAVLSYYYSDHSYVTLSASKGRQATSLGPGMGVLLLDVRNVTVSARHWLNSSWALSFEALTEQQGNLYSRKGISLGLRYAF